jgi:hypothetical protein
MYLLFNLFLIPAFLPSRPRTDTPFFIQDEAKEPNGHPPRCPRRSSTTIALLYPPPGYLERDSSRRYFTLYHKFFLTSWSSSSNANSSARVSGDAFHAASPWNGSGTERSMRVRVISQYGSLIGVGVDTRNKGKTSLGGNPSVRACPPSPDEHASRGRGRRTTMATFTLVLVMSSNFISVVASSFGQRGRDDVVDAIAEYEQEREIGDFGGAAGGVGGPPQEESQRKSLSRSPWSFFFFSSFFLIEQLEQRHEQWPRGQHDRRRELRGSFRMFMNNVEPECLSSWYVFLPLSIPPASFFSWLDCI